MVASVQSVDPISLSLPSGLGAVQGDMDAILVRIPATPMAPRGPLRPSIRHSRRWAIAVTAVLLACAGVFAERLSDPVAAPLPAKVAPAAERPVPVDVRFPASPVGAPASVARAKIEPAARPVTRFAAVAAHRRSHSDRAFARGEHKPTKGCRGSEAWCLRDQVRAADLALRDAYADAEDAGVRYATMAAVRSDWRQLRRLSDDDPRALIRGYDMLARQLRAEVGL
ncbi:hypothetical protein [Sphingomonas sp. MMS24-J13]|uniref:hypothetical protein n=1 Tax=Sphingomonas sp. MMS24-J13 TaxID=3238686 RepID=UPI00384A74E4